MNLITTFDYLKNNNLVYVKINDLFKEKLKHEILNKYGSFDNYGINILRLARSSLRLQFVVQKYFHINRILKIVKDFNISEKELYSNIVSLYAKGSNTGKELFMPLKLKIDESFIEGYALYLAEGDNGSNGKTKPRKVRLVNSELTVHKLFIEWLKTYFPSNPFYFRITVPFPQTISEDRIKDITIFLNLGLNQIRINEYKWQKRTGFIYRTCLDSAILVDFLLPIKGKIKELCLLDKNLAAAYIRGMFIGEGTAYFNRSRYVRIEMRNEGEIKYLHKLFQLLGYKCEPSLRTNRHNMWNLYIGAKQLDKFANEIGFGIHEKRQKILEQGANKVLRVNQYC